MQGTDGWHLFHVPFLDAGELTKRYVSCFAGEAVQAYTAKDFTLAKKWLDKAFALDGNSAVARNILGVIQMACGESWASRETFRQLLETEDAKEPGLHYVLLNNMAFLDALLCDPSLLPEADQFSAEALQHLPWAAPVIGTRGTVLVELGRLDEGLALLRKSMSLSIDKQNKALNACHIALGEFRRGNPEAACRYLDSARILDPSCFLIPKVETEMSESRTMDHGQ
jgi:tetratricopeptide (TPR) repeat protein